MATQVTDCVDTPIEVGSVITYPGRRGSGMWMNVGIVTAIEPRTDPYHYPPDYTALHLESFVDHFDYQARKSVRAIKRVQITKIGRVTVTPLTEAEARQHFGPESGPF